MEQLAVELAVVPASGLHCADTAAPVVGTSVSVTTVPRGTWLAAIVTGTAALAASVTSGTVGSPPGFAGAETPLTEVILTVGAATGVATIYGPEKNKPFKVPVKAYVFVLRRIQPWPPPPE